MRIDVERAGFEADGTPIVHPLSFGLRTGECVGLLGPSGAGKSTVLKMLNGYQPATEGTVRYAGRTLAEDREKLKRELGYVPQDDVVHASLTPWNELWYAGLLRDPGVDEDEMEKRVGKVLAQLGLDEVANTRIGRLSGGQRKRVSLGVELMASPTALFLDEPTAGLDPALEARMMKLFQELARQGRTVAVVTHLTENLALLDLVLVMVKGRLAYLGPSREVAGYFGVREVPEIYPRLDKDSPQDWARRYAASEFHRRYVTDRLAEPVALPAPADASGDAAPRLPPAAAKPAAEGRPEPAPTAPGDVEAEFEALMREVRGQDR